MLRVLAGAVFVAAGIAVFLLGNIQLGQVQFALLAVLATLVGVAVLTVPWWLRLVRELGEERRERIVETERAEIAAHLHDSVLQTLALIQRQTDQPREVLRLARGQERRAAALALRARPATGAPARPPASRPSTPGWPTRSPRPRPRSRTPTRSTCARSWSATRKLDDGLRALVLAAREAMVNAAKHAEVTEVSVYVEVGADRGARVRARPRRRLRRRTRCPTTGMASPTPCTAGWPGTAARSGCAARPARAPRCT